MRAAPVVFTNHNDIFYTHVDYARIIKAQGGIVVVNDADDEDETARQKVGIPAGNVVLGLGPNASATPAATRLLAELGVRVLSTVGAPSVFEPFDSPDLAHIQARAFADDESRADVARRLYSARFVDSPIVAGTPLPRLAGLDEMLTEETYDKYIARFKPPRFKRQPAGTDHTNKALTLTESLLLRTAADVLALLGLSTALGVVRTGSRLAFAQDLADAFRLDVCIPVGFIVGAQKQRELADVAASVAENLHHHRIVPRMVELAQTALRS
jgi:CRISPR/Cas system-associated endonuclease Cas1